MAGIWDQKRVPAWIARLRPYDPLAGVERNVWLASTPFPSDEPHEGWLQFDGSVTEWSLGDVLDITSGATQAFAWAFRFRADAAHNAFFLSKGHSGLTATTAGLSIGMTSTEHVFARLRDSGGNTAHAESGDVNTGNGLEHEVVVINFNPGLGQTLFVYHNGNQVASAPTSSLGDCSNSSPLYWGRGSTGSLRLDGDVERFIHWGPTLGAPNITQATGFLDARDLTAYVADLATTPVPEGAWPINEGYGERVQDVSSAELHATYSAAGPATAAAWSAIAPPPGTIPGVLVDPFSVSASLLRGNARHSYHDLPAFGAIGSQNPDGILDYLLAYLFDHRLAEVRRGFTDQPVTAFETVFVGQMQQRDKADRTRLDFPLRSYEDLFERELQTRKYEPGFEPYGVFGSVDGVTGATHVDCGDNLDRASTSFWIGAAFRTVAAAAERVIYGKKASVATISAGYALALTSGGLVRLSLGDGSTQFNVDFSPTTPINDGVRHVLIGHIDRAATTATLYLDYQQVGSVSIAGKGSLDNAVILTVGRNNAGGAQLLVGEVERVAQAPGTVSLADFESAFKERYADDVDAVALGLDHYVPFTENFGDTAGDASASGFHGTFAGVRGTGSGYLVNAGLGLPVGTTTIPVDTGTGTILAGDLVQFGGAGPSYQVQTALSGGSFTIQEPGLFALVPNNATVTIVGSFADQAWSGTPNGTRDLEGQPVRILLGRSSVNSATFVDPVKQIFQVADVATVDDVTSARQGFVPYPEDLTAFAHLFRSPGPPVGEYRWATGTFGGNAGTFVRIGGEPSGTVTWSADEPDIGTTPSLGYPAALAQKAFDRVGSIKIADPTQLNTDAPYISGTAWSEPINSADAITEILSSAGAVWTVDGRVPFAAKGFLSVRAFQVKDLSGATPIATYRLDPVAELSDFEREGFEEIGRAPVYKSVTLYHTRYRGHLTSASEPSLIDAGPPPVTVPLDTIQALMKEWRRTNYPQLLNSGGPAGTTQQIEAVKHHLGAEDYELDTVIQGRGNANLEAERFFNLHSEALAVYRAKLIGYQFIHWIGDIVDVVGRRILARGDSQYVTRRFLIMGIRDSASDSGTELELWGGWTIEMFGG